MIKTAFLAATAVSMVAIPTAASAQHRYYGQDYGYDQGYSQGYYPQGYYGQQQYGQRYYGQRAYNQRYYGQRNYRCKSGTTGAIVGGAAGALLGREIGRGDRNYYGDRGNGTIGAIIGGAVGAIAGREATRTCR